MGLSSSLDKIYCKLTNNVNLLQLKLRSMNILSCRLTIAKPFQSLTVIRQMFVCHRIKYQYKNHKSDTHKIFYHTKTIHICSCCLLIRKITSNCDISDITHHVHCQYFPKGL